MRQAPKKHASNDSKRKSRNNKILRNKVELSQSDFADNLNG